MYLVLVRFAIDACWHSSFVVSQHVLPLATLFHGSLTCALSISLSSDCCQSLLSYVPCAILAPSVGCVILNASKHYFSLLDKHFSSLSNYSCVLELRLGVCFVHGEHSRHSFVVCL